MSRSSDYEGQPILPYLSSEFLLWLWWHSDNYGSVFNLTHTGPDDEVDLDSVPSIELWVDERIALRYPDDLKVTAVLTGENPSNFLESHAALAGGKVLQELRVGIRMDDREYFATLKGPELMLHGTALPGLVNLGTDFESMFVERMLLLEELDKLLGLLFQEYAILRVSENWSEVATEVRGWVLERVSSNSEPE